MEEESLRQRVHELKLALETEKSLRSDCVSEHERLLSDLNDTNLQIEAIKKTQEAETRSLKDKLNRLTNEYETEKIGYVSRIEELEGKVKSSKSERPTEGIDVSEFDKVMSELISEKHRREDLEEQLNQLKEEKEFREVERALLERKLNVETTMHEEVRESLGVNKEHLTLAQNALKEIQEENALLTSENAVLKAGPVGDINRGNSLFREVEDNRKKLVFAYNQLKGKYAFVKNAMGAKNDEIARLKEEVDSLKMTGCGLDQDIKKVNNKFIDSLEKRIQELDSLVQVLSKRKESPEIVTISDSDYTQLQWVHTIVNEARNEARKTIADYQKISTESLGRALALRSAEIELMNQKVECRQKEGQISKLESMCVDLKSRMKENITYSKADETLGTTKSGNRTVRFANDCIDETLIDRSALSPINA